MRTWITKGLALVLVVALASAAMAQPQGRGRGTQGRGRGGFGGSRGFGGGGSLLTNQSVQKELGLSEEQTEKISKLNTEIREKYQDDLRGLFQGGQFDREKYTKISTSMREDFQKGSKSILKSEQAKRLRQIEVQGMGLNAFAQEDVQKALKLSDKQVKEAKEIIDDIRQDSQELLQDAGRDREKRNAVTAKIRELTKDEFEKYVDNLSTDQKKAWKEVLGETFVVQRTTFGRGGTTGRGGFPGGEVTVGQVMPSFLADRLELTEKQKEEVSVLEKEVKSRLDKILTSEQKKTLEELRQGRGRGGDRGRGGRGGRGGESNRPNRPGRPDNN